MIKTKTLEELNWKEIERLDRDKTVFFIPISPLEGHGPHLPVGTDLLIARDAAREAIRILNKKMPEYTFILFPSIPLGYSKMLSCFPGTVSTSIRAIKSIVYSVCSSLAKFGFKYFLICTFHMDLGHLKGIHSGMKKAMKDYRIRISEPWGPYFHNREVEKREPQVGFNTKKEVHAGFRETSLMKYQYPYLVDASHKELQSIYRNLNSPRIIGKTFKEIGLKEGYIGSPSRADSNYGRWYFQEAINTYVQSAIELVEGKKLPELPKRARFLMKITFLVMQILEEGEGRLHHLLL
jgi:creatinine amidohydrolase